MDVEEVKKLDAYLKRLFGNSRIRVVPKKGDAADVFVGEERIGALVLDDDEDDDERSYNFEMKITVGMQPPQLPISRSSTPISSASSTMNVFASCRG